jgi:hypothetical protein
MMGNDLVARERISQLMREADAERLAKPIVEARRRARRERMRARISALQLAFARRKRRATGDAVQPVPSA